MNKKVNERIKNLLKEALKIDIGEIETIAHYKAANHFLPGVEFILDIGGQELAQIGAPISFTARIAHKLLQRSDPLGLMIRNYEERQDDMMKDQRKIFRDEMAQLHRKTLERVGIDTKAMVQVMKETLDKSQK